MIKIEIILYYNTHCYFQILLKIFLCSIIVCFFTAKSFKNNFCRSLKKYKMIFIKLIFYISIKYATTEIRKNCHEPALKFIGIKFIFNRFYFFSDLFFLQSQFISSQILFRSKLGNDRMKIWKIFTYFPIF